MASQATLELLIRLKDEASAGLDRIRGTLGDVAGLAGGAALVGVAGLGAGILGGAAAGLQFNNSMEQVTAQLNAFTKDGEASAQILDMIKARAASTPFAFEEMARATASLLPAAKQSGAELESLVGVAEILAASNPAEGLEGAAFSIREALSGDFVSIVERFNLPKQRLNELKEQGVPAMEAIRIAMSEMGLDAELVTNMAGTMTGRWSTFQDTLTNLAATATQPIFDAMSSQLGTLNGVLEENQPQLQALAETIGAVLGQAVTWLITEGIPGMIAGWQAVQPALQTVGDIMTGTVIPVLAQIVGFVQANLQPILAGLAAALLVVVVPAFIAWATAAGAAAIATITALAPVVIPIAAIGAAVALLTAAWQNDWGGIRTTLTQVWNQTLRPIFDQLKLWLATTLTNAIQSLTNFWNGTLLPAFRAVASFITGTVIPAVQSIVTWFGNVVSKAGEVASAVGERLVGPLRTAADVIKGALVQAVSDAQGKLTALAGWFHSIRDAAAGVVEWIGRVLDRIAEAASVAIPDWLEGRSPPPMADWLNWIAEGAERAAGALPAVGAALPAGGAGVPAVGATAGSGAPAVVRLVLDEAGLRGLIRAEIDASLTDIARTGARRRRTA